MTTGVIEAPCRVSGLPGVEWETEKTKTGKKSGDLARGTELVNISLPTTFRNCLGSPQCACAESVGAQILPRELGH
jgi:hypothetical protein